MKCLDTCWEENFPPQSKLDEKKQDEKRVMEKAMKDYLNGQREGLFSKIIKFKEHPNEIEKQNMSGYA